MTDPIKGHWTDKIPQPGQAGTYFWFRFKGDSSCGWPSEWTEVQEMYRAEYANGRWDDIERWTIPIRKPGSTQ